MIEWVRASAALALLGVVAGCAFPGSGTLPGTSTSTSIPADAPSTNDEGPNDDGPTDVDPSDAAPAGNAATAVLLADSRTARGRGDLARAAIAVERALSIDPNDAGLWVELAEIRDAQGDSEEARTLARKALTLAGADPSIAERAGRLARR